MVHFFLDMVFVVVVLLLKYMCNIDQIVVAWVYRNIRLYDYKTWSMLSACGMFKVVNEGEYVGMIIIDLMSWLNVYIVI